MKLKTRLAYIFKKELTPYSITILSIGFAFILALIVYFSINSFRLIELLSKMKFEFLFLLITGFFLYSFKYDILNTTITFNAFIIYISNIILYLNLNLKDGVLSLNFNVVVLILFFIFTYFILQIVFYAFLRKLSIYKIEIIFIRIFLWTLLIISFNYIVYVLKIDIVNLSLSNIMFILIAIFAHGFIKTLFSFIESSIQKKYLDFFGKVLMSFFVDSVFILFSILLGSIYQKIDILNMAFFISFLAIVISLFRYISSKSFENILYHKLTSIINFSYYSKDNVLPHYPLDYKIEISQIIDQSINYLTFIVIKFSNTDEISAFYNNNIFKKINFSVVKSNCVFTVIPTKKSEYLKVIQEIFNYSEKYSPEQPKICFFNARRKIWENLDVDYILKVLINKLRKKKKNTENIIEVMHSYIFS